VSRMVRVALIQAKHEMHGNEPVAKSIKNRLLTNT
jgi:hypothetical protein